MLISMPIPKNLTPMAGSCIVWKLYRTSRGREESMTSEKITHLVKWSVNISRNWNPLYYFSGERLQESFPPYMVDVSVEFDHEDAAAEFKARVTAILDEM
jgi:hypothetical protein